MSSNRKTKREPKTSSLVRSSSALVPEIRIAQIFPETKKGRHPIFSFEAYLGKTFGDEMNLLQNVIEGAQEVFGRKKTKAMAAWLLFNKKKSKIICAK